MDVLRAWLEEHPGEELPEEIEKRIDDAVKGINAKVCSIQRLIAMLRDEEAGLLSRMAEFAATQKRIEKSIKWLQEYCTAKMQQAEVRDVIDDAGFGVRYVLESYKGGVVLGDPTLVPDDLWRHKPAPEPEPDLAEIRKLLLADIPVGTAYLEDKWAVKTKKLG
jgi:hypothetical protein